MPPQLSNVVESSKVNAAARELISALKQTRNSAISSQKDIALLVNVDNKSYQIQKKSHSLSLPAETTIKLTTAKSEQLSESKGRIRFFPDGSSTGGQITLKNETQKFVIDVNWLTSRIRLLP